MEKGVSECIIYSMFKNSIAKYMEHHYYEQSQTCLSLNGKNTCLLTIQLIFGELDDISMVNY